MGRIFREIIHKSPGFFITATDTDAGKTYFSAFLLKYTKGVYFKPIQTGEKDREIVKKNTGLDDNHFIKEKYYFKEPVSPHYAAKKAGIDVDLNKINLPDNIQKKIIVEGAGGVFSPISQNTFMIDMIKKFAFPCIVVTKDILGAINHTLLTVNALLSHNCKVSFIVLNNYNNKSYNYDAIVQMTNLPVFRFPNMKKFSNDEEIRRILDEQI